MCITFSLHLDFPSKLSGLQRKYEGLLVTNFWHLSHEQKLFSWARVFQGRKLRAAFPHQMLLLCSVFRGKLFVSHFLHQFIPGCRRVQCCPCWVGLAAWWGAWLTMGHKSCKHLQITASWPWAPPCLPVLQQNPTSSKPSRGLAESQAELRANLFLPPFQAPARGPAVCLRQHRSLLEMVGVGWSHEEAARPPGPPSPWRSCAKPLPLLRCSSQSTAGRWGGKKCQKIKNQPSCSCLRLHLAPWQHAWVSPAPCCCKQGFFGKRCLGWMKQRWNWSGSQRRSGKAAFNMRPAFLFLRD